MTSREDKILEQLNRLFTHKSIIVTEDLKPGEWEALGDPHCWILAEVFEKYSCYVDIGYGRIALFMGSVLVGEGKHSATSDSAIALDKEYYSLPHYIYTR